MTHAIVLYGEPVLETEAKKITEFDTPELHQLIDDMFESMYAAKGVGLAAPQIGLSKRIAVIDLSVAEDPRQKLVLINPEIIRREGTQTSEEGCLSIPGFREQVRRAPGRQPEGRRDGRTSCYAASVPDDGRSARHHDQPGSGR